MVGDSNNAIRMITDSGATFAKLVAPGLNYPMEAETNEELIGKLTEQIEYLDPGDYTIHFAKSKHDSKSTNFVKFRKAHFGQNPSNNGVGIAGIGTVVNLEIQALKDQIAGIQHSQVIERLEQKHKEELRKLQEKESGSDGWENILAALGSVKDILSMADKANTKPVAGNKPQAQNQNPENGNQVLIDFAQAMVNSMGQEETVNLLQLLTEKANANPVGFKSKITMAKPML